MRWLIVALILCSCAPKPAPAVITQSSAIPYSQWWPTYLGPICERNESNHPWLLPRCPQEI